MRCVPGGSERLRAFDEHYHYSRREFGAERGGGGEVGCFLQLPQEESSSSCRTCGGGSGWSRMLSLLRKLSKRGGDSEFPYCRGTVAPEWLSLCGLIRKLQVEIQYFVHDARFFH